MEKGFRVMRGKKGHPGWDYLHKDPFNTREEAQEFLDNFDPDTYKGCGWSASGPPPYDYIIVDLELQAQKIQKAKELLEKEISDFEKVAEEDRAILDNWMEENKGKYEENSIEEFTAWMDFWMNHCNKIKI